MPFPRLLLTALLASLMLVAPAHAADPVTQAMQSAYTPYRVALFRTNSQAQAESEQAMAQAVLAWRAIAQQFAAAPPVPYAQDAEFARTLGEVNSVLQKADELGPVYTTARGRVVGQKGRRQGANRSRVGHPARICNAACGLSGHNPSGRPVKTGPSSLRHLPAHQCGPRAAPKGARFVRPSRPLAVV